MTARRPSGTEFRNAMARLTSGVAIATTDGPAGRCGLTVSAVCPVTDDPPTMLVCINRDSATHDVFAANGRVCINLLAAEHEGLARHFAGATEVDMAERFAWDIWDSAAGLPALRDALAGLAGTVVQRMVHGTHSVMFVELEQVRLGGGDGLVHFHRRFHRVGSEPVR
jgi:flavin reductase (NADH)